MVMVVLYGKFKVYENLVPKKGDPEKGGTHIKKQMVTVRCGFRQGFQKEVLKAVGVFCLA